MRTKPPLVIRAQLGEIESFHPFGKFTASGVPMIVSVAFAAGAMNVNGVFRFSGSAISTFAFVRSIVPEAERQRAQRDRGNWPEP